MKKIILFLSAIVVMSIIGITLFATPPPTKVDLGATETFAVLAGSTITNTGSSVITGTAGADVGLFPGTSFTGQAAMTIDGAVNLTDAIASKAKDDLVLAYDDAAGRTPTTTIASELGGQTLVPGVYTSADGTFQITDTLTLDAQGNADAAFIFQTASTLTTASSSVVKLTNEARYCRVFWKVGSSATLGTNCNFIGHVFALTSITANTGASIQGQLLARNGAVTLDTNVINNGICLALTDTPTPTVVPTSTPTDTPISTATPIPTDTPTPIPTSTVAPTYPPYVPPQHNHTSVPTSTPVVVIAKTSTPLPTPTPSITPTQIPTKTIVPIQPTPIPTPIKIVPTNTPIVPSMPHTGEGGQPDNPVDFWLIIAILAMGLTTFIICRRKG